MGQTAFTPSEVTIIRPASGWIPLNLREFWRHRELLYFLTWRDVKVHYKQTLLGFVWAIIQPVSTMVIFTLFFGTLAKIPSEGIPYPLFSYSAVLPWSLFAGGLGRAAGSLVGQKGLLEKVYFPRLILPVSGIVSPLVDFAIASLILFGLMFYYGYLPSVRMLVLPGFILLALVTALGAGLWLSAVNVKYRDVGYTIPFLIQIWQFASPVIYATSLLPEQYQIIYGLNPMVGVIEGFRWALVGTNPPGTLFAASIAIAIVVLVSGAWYFRRVEKMFADVV